MWAFYLGVAMAKTEDLAKTEASEDATCHGVGEAADGSLKSLLLTNKTNRSPAKGRQKPQWSYTAVGSMHSFADIST